MSKSCVVILCTSHDSVEMLGLTLDGVVKQSNGSSTTDKIVIWCASGCSKALIDFSEQHKMISTVVKEGKCTAFFNPCTFRKSLALEEDCERIICCRCGLVPKENFFTFLDEKIEEYGDEGVLTAYGIRLFPHHKEDNPKALKEGVHWKSYDASKNDRAVHFFTPDFCIISVNTLKELERFSDSSLAQLGVLWCSFVLGHSLSRPVWKIQSDGIIDCKNSNVKMDFIPENKITLFEEFYTHLHSCNWPKSISHPFHDFKKMMAVERSQETPMEIWRKGFGGVNMASEPASQLDFAAAAAYGVKVIRVGAVCDAKDLAYLLCPGASSIQDDKNHFATVIHRLRSSVSTIRDYGLKVIITMTDLPGSEFHSRSDGPSFPFWESSQCRTRAATFWGMVAETLTDLNSIIMGYDVINEPYTPEDTECDFFDDMPHARFDELQQFYLDALTEIRKHNKEVAVIVKSTWFASPRAIEMLRPLPDDNIIYSFHMYAPPHLTLKRRCASSYPGPVLRWVYSSFEKIDITRESLYQLLDSTVHTWQRRHQIPSSRILVAEFGICRERKGSREYLSDLVSIFTRFGWSWLVFSFRDEEWDALDYELGPQMDNMLHRSATELFKAVSDHFH